MIDIVKNIDSLSNFKRNTAKFVKKMKKSGSPVVLTVNGKAQVVVQDAESYQRLLERIEQTEIIEGIRRGLDDVANNRTISLDNFEESLKQI